MKQSNNFVKEYQISNLKITRNSILFICYTESGTHGLFKETNTIKVFKKIREYNKLFKDKIVRFKNPLTKKEYVIQ